MNWNGKNFAGAILLAIALMVASVGERVAAQDAIPAAPTKVRAGVWGGPDLQMDVTQQGAALDFDCAQGTMLEPLLLDANGKFQVKGTFHSQRGGPIRKDQASRGVDVVYSGIVEADTMRLEFALVGDKESPQKFTLVRGEPGKLRRCR